MGALTRFLSYIYTTTMLFFSILLLELAIFVRGAARTATRRSITTEKFLKIIDKKAPARRFGNGQGVEPLECRVCLSVYEKGEEIRKLKCRHTFHKGCVDTWLQHYSAACPLCRRAVLPEGVVVKHRLHRSQQQHEEYYDGGDEELVSLLYALHGDFLRRFF